MMRKATKKSGKRLVKSREPYSLLGSWNNGNARRSISFSESRMEDADRLPQEEIGSAVHICFEISVSVHDIERPYRY